MAGIRRRVIVSGRGRPYWVIIVVFAAIATLTFAFRQAPEPRSFDDRLSPTVLGIWYTLLLYDQLITALKAGHS